MFKILEFKDVKGNCTVRLEVHLRFHIDGGGLGPTKAQNANETDAASHSDKRVIGVRGGVRLGSSFFGDR